MSEKVEIATGLLAPENIELAEEIAEVFKGADLGHRAVSIIQWDAGIITVMVSVKVEGYCLEVFKWKDQYVVSDETLNIQARDEDLATALEGVMAGCRDKGKRIAEVYDFKLKE